MRPAPPATGAASTTSTSQPRSASTLAASRPFGPAPMTIASGMSGAGRGDLERRPEDDVLAAGELQQRGAGELEPERGGHRVRLDLGVGVLQGPRPGVDLADEHAAAAVDRVEAVELDPARPGRALGGGAEPARGAAGGDGAPPGA